MPNDLWQEIKLMEKINRAHIDVGIAFASSAKRIAANAKSPCQQAIPSEIGGPSTKRLFPTMQNGTSDHSLVNKLKVMIRPFAQAIYRAIKPFLRPVGFRIREYLLIGVREDLRNANDATMAELRAIRKELNDRKNQVQSPPSELRDKLQNFTTVLSEESQHLSNEFNDLKNWLSPRLQRIDQFTAASARRIAINCGQGEILVRSEVGYILCAPSDHAVLAALLEAGELERGTRLLVQSFLKPNDVFIDVGANLGMHTLAAARAMQGRGRIIAFEPFEPTQRLLAKSIWLNGFAEMTEIHQAAVSNRNGHQTLFLGATSGHHSLFPLSTPSSLAPKPVEVPIVRLSDVIAGDTKVDLIKIDVEGAELEVLESARAIIAGNPSIALIVEFGFSHLARTGHTTKDWLAAFQGMGLVHQVINLDTGQLEEWTEDQLEAVDSVNLFFAHRQSVAWAKAKVVT